MTEAAATVAVLKVSRRRQTWLLAIGLGFVAIGSVMVTTGDATGWLAIVFFGLCSLAFIISLVRPSRLELGPGGFTVYQLGRKVITYDWHRCGRFTTYSPTLGVTRVAFDYDFPSNRRHPRLARLGRSLTGGNAALPDTYGLSGSELRDLLVKRQREATTSTP